MNKLDSIEDFDWIQNEIWPLGKRPDGGEGHTVRHLLPPSFSAYYKVLHPMYINTSINDIDLSWGETCSTVEGNNLKRVFWKEIAQKFNVSIIPELSGWSFRKVFEESGWPRLLIGPDEGNLNEDVLIPLEKILRIHSEKNETIYYCYNLLAMTDWGGDVWSLFSGYLQDVHEFSNMEEVRFSPSYWWPESKNWCVCSSYDLDFTIVGGPKELVRELSNSKNLEGFVINQNTRIDWEADQINI